MKFELAVKFALVWSIVTGHPLAFADDKTLVEAKLNRERNGDPVYIRGALDKSPVGQRTILLMFRGYPGIAQIEGTAGKVSFMKAQEHFEEMIPVFLSAGISTVTVDCPSDEQNGCRDDYRSSARHADDVKALIKELEKIGYQNFHLMGHSYGAVSSHWLSISLASDLKSVIHSSSQSESPMFTDRAASMKDFKFEQVAVPTLYLHHQDDRCGSTPYAFAKAHSRDGRLITVIGGDQMGPSCGAGSFHGYTGRRQAVAEALVRWINNGEVISIVKGPLD